MQLRVTIRRNALGSLSHDLPANTERAREAAARRVARDWAAHVHVDTRRYQKSITTDGHGTAYSDVPYAPHNEFGTRFWAGDGGQARQAAAREMDRYVKDMAAVLTGTPAELGAE